MPPLALYLVLRQVQNFALPEYSKRWMCFVELCFRQTARFSTFSLPLPFLPSPLFFLKYWLINCIVLLYLSVRFNYLFHCIVDCCKCEHLFKALYLKLRSAYAKMRSTLPSLKKHEVWKLSACGAAIVRILHNVLTEKNFYWVEYRSKKLP